jgi:hypothetical protein
MKNLCPRTGLLARNNFRLAHHPLGSQANTSGLLTIGVLSDKSKNASARSFGFRLNNREAGHKGMSRLRRADE